MYVYANETLNDVSYLLTDLSGTSAMRPETKELTKEAILRPHKKCSYMHHASDAHRICFGLWILGRRRGIDRLRLSVYDIGTR
jgi:hypothetical protein